MIPNENSNVILLSLKIYKINKYKYVKKDQLWSFFVYKIRKKYIDAKWVLP